MLLIPDQIAIANCNLSFTKRSNSKFIDLIVLKFKLKSKKHIQPKFSLT